MSGSVQLLLASDLDGTIVPRHAAAPHWYAPALRLFENLSARSDVALALISGRPLADLYRWSQGVRCYRAGPFGADIDGPDAAPLVRSVPFRAHVPPYLRAAVNRADLVLQRKRHGYAVHGNIDRPRARAVIASFTTWAIQQELCVLTLQDGVEAMPQGIDKQRALAWITAITRAAVVIFVGDDISDAHAVAWAAARGYGFRVSRRATADAHAPIQSIPALWRRVRMVCADLGIQPRRTCREIDI